MKNCKINVLGTEYTIIFGKIKDFPMLKDLNGYCDKTVKRIVVSDMTDFENDFNKVDNLEECQRKVVRHEIIHAFLHESGLDCNSYSPQNWAISEEIVDWFAIQSPKIYKVFEKLGIL